MDDHRFAGWPEKGAPLAEAIERIAGPDLLAKYLAACTAAPPYSWVTGPWPAAWPWWVDKSGKWQSPDAAYEIAKRVKESMRACLTPVIEAWNTGTVSATGRRRDVLAAAVEIPAPAGLWAVWVVDLERSIIEDPSGGKIFDLRFMVAAQAVGLSKAPFRWLERAAAKLKCSDKPPKTKAAAAKILRAQMVKDVQRDEVKSVLGVRTIANYLGRYELWS